MKRHRIGAGTRSRLALYLTIPLAILGLLAITFANVSPTHAAGAAATKNQAFCNKVGHGIQVSSGAQMACFGAQLSGSASARARAAANLKALARNGGGGSAANVDAATPAEDVSPSGVQAYGQSETSIASSGPYVVEAWNDATGFFAGCGAPMNKEELTGFGFSNNGGKSFFDLGGLPNANCNSALTEGDPSVEAYTVGGARYFYISSIYIPFNVPEDAISVTACQVVGSGATATLGCGQPIVAAISSDCQSSFGFTSCGFLDKDFLALDQARGRLYVTYTEFGPSSGFSGVEDLAMCDLSNPAIPNCHNGGDGSLVGLGAPAAPYFTVAPGDPNFCENEGAYPAVDASTGDVYVAYEHNWTTNFAVGSPCATEPTQEVVNRVPASCLPLASTSPCAGPTAVQAANIISMAAAMIPGYNRFPMNDFPRIAVSDPYGTVSIVWNDARLHPAGDILMQSYNLGALTPVQSAPVRINRSTGGWHMLPALRNAGTSGKLYISFYGRSSANTAVTNVYAALGVNPRTTSTPSSNTLITTVASNWNAVSSDIVPNFGDYTDNYVQTANATLYLAWSDGRLGLPQPFEAHNSAK